LAWTVQKNVFSQENNLEKLVGNVCLPTFLKLFTAGSIRNSKYIFKYSKVPYLYGLLKKVGIDRCFQDRPQGKNPQEMREKRGELIVVV